MIVDFGWSQHSFAQTAASQSRTDRLLPCLGSNLHRSGATSLVGRGEGPLGPAGGILVTCFSPSRCLPQLPPGGGSRSPGRRLLMSFPKRLRSPPPFPPALLPGPSPGTPWTFAILKRTPAGSLRCPAPAAQMTPPCGQGPYQPRGRSASAAGLSAVAPNSPPSLQLALRPRCGVCSPLGTLRCTLPPALGPGLDVPPSASLRAGPGRGGASVCAPRPGGAAPAPAPPPPRGPAGRGGSEAGLSSPARRGAGLPRSSAGGASSPAPSVSLPCSRRGRSDLQRSRGARSDRLGLRPRDPATGAGGGAPRRTGPLALPGKGLSGSPGSGIRGGAAGGPQSAGAFRAARSAAESLLPAPFSRALPLSLLPSHLPPSFPFSSPSVSLLSAPALSPQPSLSLLTCLSPSPLPLCLVLPLP